ncbi:MAG: S8 family serine peptidase [Bryobacterales bacterium]|nr:S8 family serine peptidase [Bryobacterales bacterium]
MAGIVASRSGPGWADYWGVARGLGSLYNLKIGYRTCTGDGRGITADVLAALDWAVQQAPWLKVFNYSYGAATITDDDSQAGLFDYFVDTYGLTISVSAGNESKTGILGLWTNPGPVSSPGIGYNVITVAAMNTQGTVDRGDDEIAIFSSRGPSIGGRKKPDIAAPGGLRDRWVWEGLDPKKQAELGIYSAAFNSDGFVPKPGTSMAAPHIAGAAALLRQAGVRDPLAIKALLLNTTDWLFWRNDQGWGYANLARAFQERNGVVTPTLPANRVRLYKGQSNGLFYTTLTWNRSVYQSFSGGCLSDLDLRLYNASSGAMLDSSGSMIDNVEKVHTTLYGPLVVNVTHWAQPSCRSPEPFGLAFSESGFQPATGPVLTLSCTAPSAVAPSSQFSAACTIANQGDLPALSVAGTLRFAGNASSSSQNFGTIQAGASATKAWLVTAPATAGAATLAFDAESNSFGGLFSGSSNLTFLTTSGSCVVTISPVSASIPAAGGSTTFTVTAPAGCPWQATSNVTWVTITGGAQGTGNGAVTVSVANNASVAPRSGTLTVAGQVITINQAGGGPVVSSVFNAGDFQPGLASATWVGITGSNFSSTTHLWQASDFVGGKLPTALGGVSVNINSRPAYVYYVSPTQINVLAPDDPAVGPVPVEVVTPQGRSLSLTAQKRALSPAWFRFDAGGYKYVAAVHPDGAYLGKPGLYPALTMRPAKPGDIVLLYGTGFGPVKPPTPASDLVAQPGQLTTMPVTVRIGGVVADVAWAGLVSSGLYQFNVTIPDLPDGDHPVVVEVGGVQTLANSFVTVHR